MKIKLITFVCVLLVLGACSSAEKEQRKGDKIKKAIIEESNFIGKSLLSIDSIIGVNNENFRAVFLFTYHDCEPCVDAGFYISKKIDSLYNKQTVYAISSMPNPHSYQQRNSYYNYIFSDEKDLIRRELKYIPTPVIFFINQNNKIQNLMFPKDTISANYSKFIHTIVQ